MSAVPYIPSILIDQVIEAMAGFLTPFVPAGLPIIRGQQNRVAPPTYNGLDPLAFIKLQEVLLSDIETPTMTQSADKTVQQASIRTPTRIDIQVDFYGIAAGDYCAAIKTVYRSAYSPDQFPAGMAPLYCNDGHQAALITGEEQYENRWALTASLQYNPTVIVPQQSALVLETNTFEDLP